MLKLVSFAFTLIIGISWNITPTEGATKAWLRFCHDGFTWLADPDECKAGYWLKKSVKPECVCAHGVWIMSKGYCDPNFVVVTGYHGTCFAFDAEVHWIRHIGFIDNPFAPYYFVSNKYLDRIKYADASVGTGMIEDLSPLVGAINPTVAVQDPKNALCVLPKQVFVENPDVIATSMAHNETLSDTQPFNFSPLNQEGDRWDFSQVEQCSPDSSQLTYGYGAGYGQVFQYDMARLFNNPPHNCSNTCLRKNEWSIETALKQILNESEIEGTNLKWEYPFSSESNDAIFDHQRKGCNETANPKWHLLPNKTYREINEQTKRLMNTHISYSLFKHKAPEVNLTEYNIFQKSRRIFEKVCPKDQVDPAVLRSLLRMFRHALNESFYDEPYRRRGDREELDRILKALQFCFNTPEDQAMTIVYNTTGCPPKISTVLYKFKGQAYPLDARNVSCYMPCEHRFNRTKYDMPIEAAWKVIMFTHYFCARHFKEIGYDHSRYAVKMEEFFNRQIIHRWNNGGNSQKAMEFLFQTYDLDKFTKAMDCCVGAARSISQYRKWLSRPKYNQYCGQREGNSYLVHNDARAAVSYEDLEPENRFIISTNGGRYYNNDTDPIWDGKAYCLKEWWEPLVVVPNYQDSIAPAACAEVDGTIFWNDIDVYAGKP